MDYDFRPDAVELRSLLNDAVEMYLLARRRAPEEHPLVTRVELAFLVGVPQPPVVYIDFDARPNAEADGDATHRCIAQLQRPKWTSFLLPPKGEKSFRATFPDGSVRETVADDVDRLLADFLLEVLGSADVDRVFDRVTGDRAPGLTVTYQGAPV